jgi:hypothetical protein
MRYGKLYGVIVDKLLQNKHRLICQLQYIIQSLVTALHLFLSDIALAPHSGYLPH